MKEVVHVPTHIQSANATAFLGMLANEHTNTDENSDGSLDGEQNEEVVVGQSSTEHIVSTENTVVGSLPGSSNAAGRAVHNRLLIYKF